MLRVTRLELEVVVRVGVDSLLSELPLMRDIQKSFCFTLFLDISS